MGDSGIGCWRVEASLVCGTGALCLGHGVVDFQDHALGAVFSMGGFVLAADARECLEHIENIPSRKTINVGVESIEFASKEKSTIIVPSKGRP